MNAVQQEFGLEISANSKWKQFTTDLSISFLAQNKSMGFSTNSSIAIALSSDATLALGLKTRSDNSNGYGQVKNYAEKNNLLAQTNMGLIYANGAGMQDYENAFKWFYTAAKGGSAEAQYNLGIAFEKGAGTKIDILKANFWFEKSADQGFEMAQSKLRKINQ